MTTSIQRIIIALTVAIAAFGCTTHHHITTASGSVVEETRDRIVVEGDAELKVVPDEFIAVFGVESFDVDLDVARRDNENRIRALIDSALAAGLDRRYLITDAIDIHPNVRRGSGLAPDQRGYRVHRSLTVIMHDAALVETVVSSLLQSGANRLDNVQRRTTQIIELRNQARLEALEDARSRAREMSDVLGVSLGEPILIEESHPDFRSQSNFVYDVATPDAGETFSVGKIRVPAKVRVVFAIQH